LSSPKLTGVAPSERESFYRRVLAERERSGKTYACVAAEHGIPVGTLAWWSTELRRRDARRGNGAPVPAFSFLPIDLAPETEGIESAAFEVTIPCGATVRVPSGFDAESLARLLRVLSATC
jgi:hypothetical protein